MGAPGGPPRSPDLTVVIPVRNGAAHIGRQLAALARQRPSSSFEVVVADNGSTDATVEEAQRWAPRLPELRVVDAGGRRGVSHARNIGLAHARADRVAFCDADDEVQDGWVDAMAAALAHDDLVAGRIELGGDRLQITRGNQGEGGVLKFLPFAPGGNHGVSRRLVDAIGNYDEALATAQDVDLSWRAQLAGFRLATVPEAVVRRHARPTLVAAFVQQFHYARDSVALYRRFGAVGMPRSGFRRGLLRWGRLVKTLPSSVGDRRRRARWCTDLARAAGRLWGSLAQRTVFL